MSFERGKRKMAGHWSKAWFLFTAITLLGIVFASLSEPELDALGTVFGSITSGTVVIILGLMGVDALPSQIIPAWKGKSDEDESKQ